MEIKETNIQTLTEWYNKNKKPFVNYLLSRYDQLRVEDAEDIYQESFVALYENVQSGRLSKLSSSLFTYLLRIGINKSNDLFKSANVRLQERGEFDWEKADNLFATEEIDTNKELVYKVVENIENPCRDLLFGYYYDRLTMAALADSLGYKDADSVKAIKYKCIKKVKVILNGILANRNRKADGYEA